MTESEEGSGETPDDPVVAAITTLSAVASSSADASGAFRRALAVGLRKEGMQVTEIAALFGVSRQRVSALIRPRRQEEDAQPVD